MSINSNKNMEIKNYEKLCRTCLKEIHNNSINMFAEQQNDKLVVDILTECISVMIKNDEELPRNMCDICIQKLNLVIDFRLMIIESNNKLENLQIVEEKENCELSEKKDGNNPTEEDNKAIEAANVDVNYWLKVDVLDEDVHANDSSAKLEKDFEFGIENDVQQDEINFEAEDGEKSDKSSSETPPLMKLDDKIKFKHVDLIKHFDLSEYEHLPKTLKSDEKRKTKLKCKICNRSISYYYFFNVHLMQHLGKKPYKCDVCDKTFATSDILKHHKVVHSDTKGFTCEWCGKSFKQQCSLQFHTRIHKDVYPFECKLCNKKYKYKNSLETHECIHKGEKKYVCEVCGKSFVSYTTLYVHKKIHVLGNKFICAVCGRGFKTNSRLKEHNKVHTGYRPHKCGTCNRCFRTSWELKTHVAIHTGVKAYACKVCGKKFMQYSCIGRHMRTHTGETPFSCKICPAKFKYSHHLLKHMKKHK